MFRLTLIALMLSSCADDEPRDAWPSYGHEYSEHIAIVDADGDVRARGWARQPLFLFDRAAVPTARADRIREWDFYAIHARELAIMVTLAEVRFAGLGNLVIASLTVHDFARAALHGGSLLLPDPGAPNERLALAPRAGGDYRVDNGSGSYLAYEAGPTARTIRFALDRVQGGGGGRLEGVIEVRPPPGDESIALVTPFFEPGHFFYENKVMAMPVSGRVTATAMAEQADLSWELGPGDASGAFAVMDWVRAVVPEAIDWTWAVGGGVVEGRRVGLNFGSVFGDERGGTADAVLVDGVLHKLPPVHWDERDPDGGWRMSSDDGRVDLWLLPNGYRERQDLDLGFYRTRLDKPYGVWSGTIVLDDGERLAVDGLFGAAERVHTEW